MSCFSVIWFKASKYKTIGNSESYFLTAVILLTEVRLSSGPAPVCLPPLVSCPITFSSSSSLCPPGPPTHWQTWVTRRPLASWPPPPSMPSTSWGTSARTSPRRPCKQTHTHTHKQTQMEKKFLRDTAPLHFSPSQVYHQNCGQSWDPQRDEREPEGSTSLHFTFFLDIFKKHFWKSLNYLGLAGLHD